ncbi:MAG: phosphorylase kinase [Alteromonadaceae bacterium]|nr:MAG: phosphorylase kinase [Alteromonadaceae bacterium]
MKPEEQLDRIFIDLERVVLCRQHPISGLLPASTAVNQHGDYTDAWVRDNVYSVMCVWSLGMAYRRLGESVKSDQLEQATIKLMRGLLQAMMRQADKVETFKHTLNPGDALHAKYDTATGAPVVGDFEWGHLQVDATSLFLLMLAQMSASGLRLIHTYSEVDFIQNLIYYISTAYRTPDFGIWERGNKINNGKTEINASSVGMAKAALQVLDGLNLFGKDGPERAVVHTVPDAISHARHTLASLLPRESLSKEVDSAILSIIGFPAFAVGDQKLATKTRDEILTKLGGEYGCKRFLWDGHQTAIEDGSRLYYEHSELSNFENVESEWPLFFTFLYIDALFNENDATAKHYREKIENLMVDVDGVKLIPELYYLPEENIAAEKGNPKSQTRVPNENVPLVWAQSLYITGLLLDEGLLSINDLDPLRMRTRSRRFVQSQTALVVLAENDAVKQTLAQNGVISETLDDIAPLSVISAPYLVEAYAQLGANEGLGLTGRPRRRLQSLSTSQTYKINDRKYLCLSWLQNDDEDYRVYDAERASHKIRKEIAHIKKHWLNSEVAVFTYLMEERLCNCPDASLLYETLRKLQLRTESESVGYASAGLAYRASKENRFIIPQVCITPLKPLKTQLPKSLADRIKTPLTEDAQTLVAAIGVDDQNSYQLVSAFIQSHRLTDNVGVGKTLTVRQLLEYIYTKACEHNYWLTSRYCFAVLNRFHTDLADGIVLLSSRHLSVSVGSDDKHTPIDVDASNCNEKIVEVINAVVDNLLERTLVQETLSMVGALARTTPELFDGMRSIQTHNLLGLCAGCGEGGFSTEGVENLAKLSPSELLEKVQNILDSQQARFSQGISVGFSADDKTASFFGSAESMQAIDIDWLEWRSARGLIPRFDAPFLKSIWQSLAHAESLIFSDSGSEVCSIDCERVRSSMTPGEESFARLIDEITQHVHPPYYKSMIIESLYAFTQFSADNPTLNVKGSVDLAGAAEAAAEKYVIFNKRTKTEGRNMDIFIEQSPFVVQKYLAEVFAEMA